jgi:hypothetical protein
VDGQSPVELKGKRGRPRKTQVDLLRLINLLFISDR